MPAHASRRESYLVKRVRDLCTAPHKTLTTTSQPIEPSHATRAVHGSSHIPAARCGAPAHEGEDADDTHDNTQSKTWWLEAQFDVVRPRTHA